MRLARKLFPRPWPSGGRWEPRGTWRRLGLSGLLALAACQPRAGRQDVREWVVFAEDFEHLAGWLPPDPTLTTERAHSGRYAVKVDKEHPFSITYRLTLGEKFMQRPRLMRLSAWVWVTGPDEAAELVLVGNSPDAPPNAPPQVTSQLFLSDYWPYKRWTYISRDVPLPPEVSARTGLVVYVWHNAAKDAVFTDDWQLTEIH
ncbi:hypothetical protein [uncultured Hymenobacter sp.]|uniref:hypothetical protein n=1 Tax=uncultured Hymenobacter sp. TaxID=170016 RepID=UPI0035CBCFE2